jgi:type I restriction enzyme M protein
MPPKKTPPPPPTTAQRLGSLIKSVRDIMRKDKGLNGDLDRLPMLTWILFLKFLDDMEQLREDEAVLAGKRFTPTIEQPYRWRDWAAREDGITGNELIAFISQDEATLPDGSRGPGLFACLRSLRSDNGRDRRDVVANVFKGVYNRMTSGYLLRDVINKVNNIHFTSSEEIHTLGHLYESLLKEMRDAAGDSGEFYTPRPVVQFMVAASAPQLGETVLDPACGTGGFLVEAFDHLKKQCQTVEQRQTLQERSIYGGEAKSLPYLLAQMNLLLHGLSYPNIDFGNSLTAPIMEIGDSDRVDVILTNPPFGGEEEAGIKSSFPQDKQTAETALLFLQLIMRKLRRIGSGPNRSENGGRAAVVVPNGTLFGDGVCARIKQELLREFNLHTIVRLPNGVFAPYTPIPTNLLFFDRHGPTKDIWYYELPLPEGRKNYTKTKPIQFAEFAQVLEWWNNREEGECAWRVDFQAKYEDALHKAQPHWDAANEAEEDARTLESECRDIQEQLKELERKLGALPPRDAKRQPLKAEKESLQATLQAKQQEADQERQKAKEERATGDGLYWPVFNLDLKNPNAAEELEHLPPEQLIDDILEKEAQIMELLREIKAELREGF